MKKCVLTITAAGLLVCLASPARSGNQTTVVTGGLLVTQFAVPVAVPQYAAPVASPSYVQYGAGYSTSSTESLEDRIAAKVIQGLQAAGTLRPAAQAPTLVVQNCSKCHSGATPKGNLDLSSPTKLSSDDRLRAIRAVLDDDEDPAHAACGQRHQALGRRFGQSVARVVSVPKEVSP